MRKMGSFSLRRGFFGLLIGAMASGAVARDLPLEFAVDGGRVTPAQAIAYHRIVEEAPLDMRASLYGGCLGQTQQWCLFKAEAKETCFADFSAAFRVEIAQVLRRDAPVHQDIAELLEARRGALLDGSAAADCMADNGISEAKCAFYAESKILSDVYVLRGLDELKLRQMAGEATTPMTPDQEVYGCLATVNKLAENYRVYLQDHCAMRASTVCDAQDDRQACETQLARGLFAKAREILALFPNQAEAAVLCEDFLESNLQGVTVPDSGETICDVTAAYVDLHAAFGLARLAGVTEHLD